jgi:peptidoglycan/xylan/chitin deacetylase (PgdA/CDA1 family)
MSFLTDSIKPLAKSLLARPFLLKAWNGTGFVLCYHDISTPDAPWHDTAVYSTTPELFRAQVEDILRYFNPVSLDNAMAGRAPKGKPFIVFTFDDGFKSVLTEALPHFETKGIPFTCFVNKLAIEHGWLPVSTRVLAQRNAAIKAGLQTIGMPAFDSPGPDAGTPAHDRWLQDNAAFWLPAVNKLAPNPYMNAEDLRTLVSEGVQVQSHTATHPVLSSRSSVALQSEIVDHATWVGEITGQAQPWLALPFGKRAHWNEAVLETAERAGHQAVFSTNPVPLNRTYKGGKVPVLPRVGVTNESPETLRMYLARPLFRKYQL